METFAYLHAAVAYEAPESVDSVPMSDTVALLQGLNWRQMPAQTATSLLALACSLSIIGAAGNALALQRNDSGSAVATLQNDLNRTGYYDGPITGFYGELTETAIARFQQENGLPADGVAGPETLEALRNKTAQAQALTTSTTANATLASRPAAASAGDTVLQRGDQGSAVSDVQNRLRNAGYFDGPITGFFGDLTEAGVTRFQQDKQLTVDGRVGPATLAALRQAAPAQATPAPAQGGPASPVADTSGSGVLGRGDRGAAVADLQNRLRAAGYFDGPMTGFYGRLTEESVARFQQAKGLTADGKVGSATLAALRQASTAAAPASTQPAQGGPASPVASSSNAGEVLQRGDSGTTVADLQNRLRSAGYFDGPMTGFYGRLTEAAVVKFQQAKGLTADGKAGAATLSALRQSSTAQTPAPAGSGDNANTAAATTNDVLQRGDRGVPVADLQNRLRNAGYFDGPMTGFYGRLTEAAVVKFQQAKGLTADGKVGPKTIGALRQATASNQGGNSSARPQAGTNPSPQPQATTSPSPQAQATTSPSPQARATTSPSPQAQATTSPSPQARQSASPSPQAQATTSPSPQAQATTSPSPQAQATTSPSPQARATTSPSPQAQSLNQPAQRSPAARPANSVLQKGNSGPEVAELQSALRQTKYLEGQITGFFGDLTEAAVIKFQRANGLPADGKAGPRTLEALRKAVEAANPSG